MVSFFVRKVVGAVLLEACVIGGVYAYKKYKDSKKNKALKVKKEVVEKGKLDSVVENAKNELAKEKKVPSYRRVPAVNKFVYKNKKSDVVAPAKKPVKKQVKKPVKKAIVKE